MAVMDISPCNAHLPFCVWEKSPPGTWRGHFECLFGSHMAMRPVILQWDLMTLLTSGYDLILKTEVSLFVPSWQVGVASTDWKWHCQPSSRLLGARVNFSLLEVWSLVQA